MSVRRSEMGTRERDGWLVRSGRRICCERIRKNHNIERREMREVQHRSMKPVLRCKQRAPPWTVILMTVSGV